MFGVAMVVPFGVDAASFADHDGVALRRFLVYIGMSFGALAGGFLANAFGIRSALAVNGATVIAIGLSIPYLLRGVDYHAQSMPQVTA